MSQAANLHPVPDFTLYYSKLKSNWDNLCCCYDSVLYC